MQTPPPEPPLERSAVLASEGYTQRAGQRPRFTPHTYVDVIRSEDHVGKPGWAQRWKCSVTGVVRVWGFIGNRHDSELDVEDDESSDDDTDNQEQE